MEALLFSAVVLVAVVFGLYDAARSRRVSEARLAAWSAFAERQGLSFSAKQAEVTGEHRGVPVRLRRESRDVGRGEKEWRVVLGADVAAPLPDGFVAAPRAWTNRLERALATHLFPAGDVALDDLMLFQSDRLSEGRWLLGESDVREALRGLFGPGAVGFVEKRKVAVAWKENPEDPEHLARALDAVAHAADTLRAASARALAAGVWPPE